MSRRNPSLDAVTRVLNDAGVAYTVETGGRHLKVTWRHEDQARLCVVSISPSTQQGPRQARATVRRLLRLDGITATP